MRVGLRGIALLVGILSIAVIPLSGQTGFGGLGGFGTSPFLSGTNVGATGLPPAALTPFLGVTANYWRDIGIPQNNALLSGSSSYSVSGSGGIYGAIIRPHTVLSLGYVGNVNYWRTTNNHWVQNHVASVQVAHQVNPSLKVFTSIMGGTSIGGYGYGGSFLGLGGLGGLGGSLGGGIDPSLAGAAFGSLGQNGIVDNEILNNRRVEFAAASGGLSYRLSERWFISGNGGAAIVRRKGSLSNTDMEMASGGFGYRLDEHSQISLNYGYNWVTYPKMFGGVHSQSAGLGYARSFSQRSSISLFGGGFQVDSQFIGQVALDPDVAALLGTASTYQLQKVHYRSFAFGASYSYSRNRHGFGLSVVRGFAPGNGVLLASKRDAGTATYSYSGLGKWSASVSAMLARDQGLVGVLAHETTYQITAGTGRQVVGQLFFNVNFGYRGLWVPPHQRSDGIVAIAGLFWSPHQIPLHF